MAFTKNEEAVSPVIGVILMVAITVILAAVIAAFVFGMAGGIQKTKVATATVSRIDGSNIGVTFQGGQDAASVLNVTITANGATKTMVTGTALEAVRTTALPVGSYGTYAAATNSKIVGIAYFTDGASQVIIDTTI